MTAFRNFIAQGREVCHFCLVFYFFSRYTVNSCNLYPSYAEEREKEEGGRNSGRELKSRKRQRGELRFEYERKRRLYQRSNSAQNAVNGYALSRSRLESVSEAETGRQAGRQAGSIEIGERRE